MLLNQGTTATTPAARVCGNCSIDAQQILHNVRHRGIFRRLCTSCVLRLHPQSFCPTCFTVYQPSQPPVGPNGVVTCVKCYSASHSSCVGMNHQSRYICPMCVNPNAPIFVLKKAKELNLSVSGSNANGMMVYDENDKIIDRRAAKILVVAATISSLSMSEAELAAKSVAERRAKEAAITRKRATQALDYMAALAAREKMKTNHALPGSRMGVSMSRFPGIVGNGLTERGDGYGYSGAGNGRSDLAGVRIEEKNQVTGIVVDRSSNEVLTRDLNGAELKDNKRLGGVGPQGSGFLELSSCDAVAMDVDEQRLISSGSGLTVGDLAVQNHDGGVSNKRSCHPAKLQDGDGRSVSNGVVLNHPKEDWMEGVENSNPGFQDLESTDPGHNKNGLQQ